MRGAGGEPIGLFLHDNFARPTKRSGAWMSSYRLQSKNGGSRGDASVLPIIVNNNNFAKGAPGEPTLLSFDDARTLFHEFGHGLHGLLSNVTYERLSGTNVLRDFVELPSQLFEHWLEEPEVLKRHARHHLTGQPIPDALVERLHAARHFNQGYETVRYTASALVDMAAHARRLERPADVSPSSAPSSSGSACRAGVGLNHRLTHFQHLFSGSGYAAGYYVYLWAEVLDADGYEAFVEAGDPFDAAVAERLRRFIYSSGNSIEPGAAYRAFRGRAPTPEPMLRKRGLVEPVTSSALLIAGSVSTGDATGDVAGGREALVQRREEGREVDRLGPVVGEAGGEGALDVLGHRVGRQRDAGDRGGARVGAQPAQHLEAVEVGQLHVHQHQVGRSAFARATPARAVRLRRDRQAGRRSSPAPRPAAR